MLPICTKQVLSGDFYMWNSKIHFVELSLCYNLVKTRSQNYFSVHSYGILNTAKTSNLKVQNNEKMAVKEKEPYFNIIKTNFQNSQKNLKI